VVTVIFPIRQSTKQESRITPNTFLFHSPDFALWNLGATHPTQGRRYPNALKEFELLTQIEDISYTYVEAIPATREELSRVHDIDYISEVLDSAIIFGARTPKPEQSRIATLFAGASLQGLRSLIAGQATTAINFAGAKHHAQFDHGSGFCVFNDFAICADIATNDFDLKVAIFDLDAHHGDGTENLTRTNSKVFTYSIHQNGIFPGTGKESFPEDHVYNRPLRAGDGDSQLLNATDEFIRLSKDFEPDLLFIAAGADGHESDPLADLQYSFEVYEKVARTIRTTFPAMPILMGGSGGYQPDTYTPSIWASFALSLAS